MRAKRDDYFAIGVKEVSIVEPHTRSVLVYRSLTGVTKLGEDDRLEGENVLKGFSLHVVRLFRD